MKILWGSPLPPVRSGVSDYAVDLLAELAKEASIRVLQPPDWIRPGDWPLGESVQLVVSDAEPESGEISLIHLGNNPHHLWLLDRLQSPHTVVVLHDLVLHHLLVEAGREKGEWRGGLESSLQAAHGDAGLAIARGRQVGLTGRRDPFLFPARQPFLAGAAGAVVHSEWAETQVRRERPDLPCLRVGLPVMDPGPVKRASVRTDLGLHQNDVVLMHLGFLTPEKGLKAILAGLAAAIRLGVPARLVLIGEGHGLEELQRAAEVLGVGQHITSVGWVAAEDFPRVPAAADLGVVLRTPSAGETSAAAIRFFACGVPVAVGGLHQFLEWPENAAPRLTPGPTAAADLARLLVSAGKTDGSWDIRRLAARESYDALHRPERSAEIMLQFLEDLM